MPIKFELNIEGVSCVKCVSRIETALYKLNPKPLTVKVDFITNKVVLTLTNKDSINLYTDTLNNMGYTVLQVKEGVNAGSDNSGARVLRIKVTKGDPQEFAKILPFEANEETGILENILVFQNRITIKYDPYIIRGSQIVQKMNDIISENKIESGFEVENPFEENDDLLHFSTYTGWQVMICLFCMMGLVVLSFLPMDYITYPEDWGIGSAVMLFTLITTAIIMRTVGYSIFKLCIQQFRQNNTNMITLISIGSGLAFIFGFIYFGIGLVNTFNGNLSNIESIIMTATSHLQTSAAIFTSVVAGKYIQGTIKKRVYQKINEIKTSMKVNVTSVKRIIPKNRKLDILSTEDLHPALIEKDDLISVKEGLLPFDGFIEMGSVQIVENAQFGWENIETRSKGHKVMSGSKVVFVEDKTILRATEPLEQTVAGKLFFVIKDTTAGSQLDEKTSEFIAKFTKWFIAAILIISLLVFLFWLADYFYQFAGVTGIDLSFPFERAVTVLVASCPCALGTALPMIYAIAIRKALKNGVLVKDSSAIDNLGDIDTVVFDKTGTITGSFNVRETKKHTNKFSEATLWEIISYVERDHLQHPIGLAIYQEALKRLSGFDNVPNIVKKVGRATEKDKSFVYYGSEGIMENSITINGVRTPVSFGNTKLMKRIGITGSFIERIGEDFKSSNPNAIFVEPVDEKSQDKSKINLFLAIDNEIAFEILMDLKESLKDNVHELMNTLRKYDKNIHLLTGDNRTNALETASALGIKHANVKAEVTPYEKEDYIRGLVKEGHKVMMVGDGINDIKAFQEATLSCTINFKSPQNLSFSNFVIIDNDVKNIAGLFKLARVSKFFKITILAASVLYNVPVTIAASGLLDILIGYDLPAFMAAWTMFLSSVILTLLANFVDCFNFKDQKKVKVVNPEGNYVKLEASFKE